MKTQNENIFTAPFIQTIKDAGGRCLLVGGAVIDHINDLPIKDWDIEVYGLNYETLLRLMEQFGKPHAVGKAFGVIKITIDEIDYDLSIPRKENRIGKGHKDFLCELHPDMTPAEAAKRRDLTINSMYLDLHTLEIIDPYNGMEDLKKGIIRVTNRETFQEDPLRVLRIMQILPRKGKKVAPATVKLCREMVHEFPHLSKERLMEEWKKLLLRADKPSMGLEFLRQSQWIQWFPELQSLIGCRQNPLHHPEGDVWKHTLIAIDAAAELKKQLPEDWHLAYMFGILLHDTGKPDTTNTDTLKSHGHDKLGEEKAKIFMRRICDEKLLIERVTAIVGLHMQPGFLHKGKAKHAAWRRLHNKLRLDVLAMVAKADALASGGINVDDKFKAGELAMEYFQKLGDKPIAPVLQGRHLIEAGYQPGRQFTIILKKAYEYQLDTGCEDVQELLEMSIK